MSAANEPLKDIQTVTPQGESLQALPIGVSFKDVLRFSPLARDGGVDEKCDDKVLFWQALVEPEEPVGIHPVCSPISEI